MRVLVYKSAMMATQSISAKTKRWRLDFVQEIPRTIDPLMGWTSSCDMQRHVHLRFSTRKEAVSYARRHGLAFMVVKPRERTLRSISYSDNFRFDRRESWTH